jgi:hypothetical protein
MNKMRMQNNSRGTVLILSMVLSLLLPACFSTFSGKFQAQEGIPQFIKRGQTTRSEVFDKLGEPLVHRFVAGTETAVYGNDRISFWFLYSSYEGHELVIRFENQIVSDVRIEKTGSGWGLFMQPAVFTLPAGPRP